MERSVSENGRLLDIVKKLEYPGKKKKKSNLHKADRENHEAVMVMVNDAVTDEK